MPVFSAAWWKGRDFTAATLDAPLGSGAYKVKTFEQGRFIEYERDPTIGARSCRSISARTISTGCASNIIASGRSPSRRSRPARSTTTRSTPRASGPTSYDFPAVKDGRVKKEVLHNGAPSAHAGLVSQHPPRAVQGPARPRGDRPRLRFRMDQQEHHVFVLQADRLLLSEHRHGGEGQAGAGRTQAARAVPRQARPVRVRRPLYAAGQRRLGLRPQAAQAGLRPAARGRLQARRRRR